MKWNNGKERAHFEREQAKLRKEYFEAGMTEKQIQAIYAFDLKYLNLRQREARHTQRLNITPAEDNSDEETKNPLLKKFLHSFSVEDKYFGNERFDWIDQIEDERLYKAISALSDYDKEILTMLICDGIKQKDIAEKLAVKKAAISRKIMRLKNFLKKFLNDVNF